MSLAAMDTTADDVEEMEGFEPYRAVSKAAVASLVFGVLAVLGLFFPALVLLGVLGVGVGLIGLRGIKLYPQELTGAWAAWIGVFLSATLAVAGTARHSYVYATEVPEGYVRISFANLQPSTEQPDLPVSPESLEFDGKKIFVKGYMYPDGSTNNIKRFVLVPDMGTCCFGGQPKLTDMIEVTLQDPLRAAYAVRKMSLGGVLHVDTRLKPVSGLNGVFYQLDADLLK